MAVLVITQGAHVGAQFSIEDDPFVLGRDKDCQLQDPFRQLGGVSRHHAQIVCADGHYFLEDMASRNGTYQNGNLIAGRVELSDGDTISICDTILKFSSSSETLDGPHPRSPRAADMTSVSFDLLDEPVVDSAIPISRDSILNTAATQDAARKLEALVALLDKMGRSLDVDQVLDQFLDGLFTVFPDADRGVAAMRDDKTGEVTPHAVRFRDASNSDDAISLSQTLVNRVLEAGEAVLSANAMQDERFRTSRSLISLNVRSLMCVPLIGRSGNRLGILQLDATGEVGRFTRQDLAVLASIVPHAVSSMEYAKMHAEELRLQAVQSDLEFARQIQRNFLPSSDPEIDEYDFFSFYEAAHHVGGDYFDYIELTDGRIGVVVADVAGKGVSAALLMSKFAAEFKYLLSREESLDRAVTRMNDVLTADESMTRFITMVIAVLDPKAHQVTLVNAGHTDPLLRTPDGKVVEVGEREKGAPLGLFPEQQYEVTRFELGPGDALLLYSDGLNEATRADDALYGVDRIKDVLAVGAENVGELGSQIIRNVQDFVAGRTQSDDMCVLCIKRKRNDA